MRVSRIMRVGYVVCVCACAIAAALLFVLRDELRWEREVLDRSYTMLMDHEVVHAATLVTTLDSLLLGRLRAWRNWRNPYERLLRGTIKMEQGEYAQAIRYLEESITSCASGGFDAMRCRQLNAEMLFRQGNAAMLGRQRHKFTVAIAYFEKGLLLHPDDVFAKKSLEWLKLTEEEAEQKKGDKSPSRASDVYEKKGQTGEGGNMREGY